MKIINMEYAPIIGYQSNKIKKIAKKIAQSYNESIDDIDNQLFLGFKFKNIPELKYSTASFNFKESLLEINISNQTKIIIPSRRASEHVVCRLFEFSDIKAYDKKTHVLIEKKLNKYNLIETRTGKGKASSWISKKIGAGLASAKAMLLTNIEIQNSETIEELSKNINDNIKSILDFEPGHDKVVDAITNFVKSGNVSEINKLYDIIFDNSLKSKFAKETNKKIIEEFTNKMGEVEAEKKVLDSKLDEIIANAYNTHKEFVKSRYEDDTFGEFISKIYTRIGNGISIMIDTIKTVIASIIAWEFSTEGVANSLMNAASWIMSKFIELLQWFVGPSTDDKEKAEVLTKSQEWLDWGIGWLNKGIQAGQELVQWTLEQVNSVQEVINEKLKVLFEPLTTTTTGKYIAAMILAIVAVYIIIKLFNIIKSGIKISDLSKTTGGDAAASFSIQNLTSNAGFDKIFVTEAILGIIQINIENTLKNGQLTKDEELRIKKLNHIIYNTSKKKSKEGIKFFVNNIDKYVKEVEDTASQELSTPDV